MTWPVSTVDISHRLDFKNDRISDAAAQRQLHTVSHVLAKLAGQPGLILADEVGMGKTFVALGVAMMAALNDRGRRPVIVMVPSSLHQKWPRDFDVFREHVIKRPEDCNLRYASANSGLELFRQLDSATATRPHIIFLKHGAFNVQNVDQWVRLALIKRAMVGMHLGERRTALPRFAADLLRTKSSFYEPALYARLLAAPAENWGSILATFGDGTKQVEQPVPKAVRKILQSTDIELKPLRECLRDLPARESGSIETRLAATRAAINDALKKMWPSAFAKAKFRSPLLILDEAHHLKNPSTRLASLFVNEEESEDAKSVAGSLEGRFERMLFLTATPFQLGHSELLNVISRFRGVDWKGLPEDGPQKFEVNVARLRTALDAAQNRSTSLDKCWQILQPGDLVGQDQKKMELEAWWALALAEPSQQSERVQTVIRAYTEAVSRMKDAELLLKEWIVRHLRDRFLPNSNNPRRARLVGQALSLQPVGKGGLVVAERALLPFLLAARAQAAIASHSNGGGRATFAEGLASSYEAFLNTSEIDEEAAENTDSKVADRYVQKLRKTLPDPSSYAAHPKIAPLIDRVLDLWRQGEKVVIFCHYRQTGRAIMQHLSAALEKQLWTDAARRLRLSIDETKKAVTDFGGRFDSEGGMRPILTKDIDDRLGKWPELSPEERSKVHEIVRRFIRTPLFVARYFDDLQERSGAATLAAAMAKSDLSDSTLGKKIDAFLGFIAKRCTPEEREAYLEALRRVQPGEIRGEIQRDSKDDLEQMSTLGSGDKETFTVMPNIRLANGLVRQDTRQRLMLSFNTPFFPEILVASSVLAEGVDLHLNCRYIIHHDLSWNPSTLEQRTGRVDRIGAKAEVVGKSVEVFLPYVDATQDEKQYRVVMDRERWFQVLMGEDYRPDENYTDMISERVELPLAAAEALAFDLSVAAVPAAPKGQDR